MEDEAAVTARTRCGWATFVECGVSLFGRTFPLKLNGAIYKSCVRPAILYGSEDQLAMANSVR